jgi:hypothetical protein
MSKSLTFFNGDLVIGSGRAFETVEGRDKLIQDLKLWILERIGTDPSTPTFGSRLDGGFENGRQLPSYIGQIISDEVLGSIRNEIIVLIQRYQAMQYQKMRSETIQYLGKNTLAQGEVVESINSVNVTSTGSIVVVQVIITTLQGNQLKLTLPLDMSGAV